VLLCNATEFDHGVNVEMLSESKDRRVHHQSVIVAKECDDISQHAWVIERRVRNLLQCLTPHLDVIVVNHVAPQIWVHERLANETTQRQYAVAKNGGVEGGEQ